MQVSVSSTMLFIDDSHNSGHLFSGQKFNILINILEFLYNKIRQTSDI